MPNSRPEQQLELTMPAAASPWRQLSQWLWPQGELVLYDRVLVVLTLALMAIGLVMVSSASFPVADRLTGQPFYFIFRHAAYLLLTMAVIAVAVQIPMQFWQDRSAMLLLGAIALLVAVLLIGHTVNGAKRWIKVGPITIQAAEIAKLCFFTYMASYLVRRYEEVRENLKGFIKPLAVLFTMAALLLAEPDLGTVVVMSATVIGMLFLAGARLWQFFAVLLTCTASTVLLIVLEQYRMRRILSFWDPWQDPFGSGYQLTQSLMAFGRGNIDGQGLGNSIQKLQYLPEAHTDFIMAVMAEELGFIGIAFVLALFLCLVVRTMLLGRRALADNKPFSGFLAYGIAIWFSFQAMVNVGAAAGLLPTKGLTLPLISYGGTSLLVSGVAIAMLLRIDYELRLAHLKVTPSRRRSA
ncbi:cell division-specific peptidoglycan biosynthesis regulator FtsW [Pseudidiomarina planktonica]|uniref:Probable peptidoglycan glycosyltransferase FtsW n=1 Tax=Pseudidiomarina planktonica TaxID=1323738 RepID=A0A1Y6EDW6_9GAMM|nr:cell division protein FtsW [Pseudidiomarina planktonica]RUO66062.1 cell division protein FtsW [Pseudidiomarina planktonica]SMQ60755.1 cell division-specific peptidoglycan biosynthesis regulator FtsW [Pseudidiomarina planktonica]